MLHGCKQVFNHKLTETEFYGQAEGRNLADSTARKNCTRPRTTGKILQLGEMSRTEFH